MVDTALGVGGNYLCFDTAFLVQWASVKSQSLESIFYSLRKE